MGFFGGNLAYWFLKRYYAGGQGIPMSQGDPYLAAGVDKFKRLFGDGVYDELRGKSVLDFGCGAGTNALLLARNGCTHVVGIDVQEPLLQEARQNAKAQGLDDRCSFVRETDQLFDVVVSTDAFEHFEDPAEILRVMKRLLKPDGYLLIEFGCTWFHPLGGHLFSVFPWAHLIFTEKALMRWRSDFKTDGATKFGEVVGGLNQITLKKWEQYVRESDFAFSDYELVPIRAARKFHGQLTREFLTSFVRARLRLSARPVAQDNRVAQPVGS